MTMVIAPEVSPIRLRQFIGGLVGIVIAVGQLILFQDNGAKGRAPTNYESLLAGSLGPVLGGLLTQYTTWRWVFWIK